MSWRCHTLGDELHHYGWNRCNSPCHGPDRSHLIVPGFRSLRVHVLNVADDPRRPQLEKVIEPEEIVSATGFKVGGGPRQNVERF
jgi:selenium-binding protein 1